MLIRLSELPFPSTCDCGETRVRREDVYVLVPAQRNSGRKPFYSNTKFLCIKCGKPRFEKRYSDLE